MKAFKQKNYLYYDFLDEIYSETDIAILLENEDVVVEIKGKHTIIFIDNTSEYQIIDTDKYNKALIMIRSNIIDNILG